MATEPVSWTTYPEAATLLCRGATVRATWKIAIAVGTFLTIVNLGTVIAARDATWVTWIRVAANYLTPFLVSSAGFLAARRR